MNRLKLQDLDISKSDHKVCSKCIYDTRVSNIYFDDNGVCNYCTQIDSLVAQYGTGLNTGAATFDRILQEIKKRGKNKKYDCVVGVSGGTDSSYLLYLAKKNGT